MKPAITATLLCLPAVLAGCEADTTQKAPQPVPVTRDAVGHYCGMIVEDHAGPKAQIHLADRADPLFFTQVRDAIAFTMLPEEPDNITAFYVQDMSRAESWAHPGEDAWMAADAAVYVIGSDRRGGMGAAETVPFSNRSVAEDFVSRHGGRIVTLSTVPRDAILAESEDDRQGMDMLDQMMATDGADFRNEEAIP